MHYFSTLLGTEVYMFRTDLLSIIRSPNTLFTEQVFVILVMLPSASEVRMTSLADGNITCTINTYCYE